MKNRTDRDQFLDDLLGGDLRTASLAHTLSAARSARKMRRLRRCAVAVAILTASVATFLLRSTPPPPVQIAPRSEPLIRMISDDELLAHFPDRAVALVGPPEHRQLIFLDAAK
jgi:hypothetical protein